MIFLSLLPLLPSDPLLVGKSIRPSWEDELKGLNLHTGIVLEVRQDQHTSSAIGLWPELTGLNVWRPECVGSMTHHAQGVLCLFGLVYSLIKKEW